MKHLPLSLTVTGPRVAYFDADEAADEPVEVAYEIPTAAGEDGAAVYDFAGFDDESLAALEAAAVEAFHERNVDGIDADGLAELTRIADDIDAIRAEATTRREAAEANAAAAAELAARVAPAEPEAVEDADEAAEPVEADAEPVEAEAEVVEGEPVAAHAAAQPRPVVRTRLRGPALHTGAAPARATQVQSPLATLVASGTDQLFTPAHEPTAFDIGTMARMVQADYERRTPGVAATRYLGRITAPAPEHLTFDGGPGDAEKWAALTAPRDIDTLVNDGAMVASGCGPAETVYTHVNDAMLGDLLDVPERFVTRGSIEFPNTIDTRDFVDQLAANGSWLDGDANKAVITFTCPTYMDPLVIEARYLRLKFTNMVRRSNPEFYEDVVQKMLIAHEVQKHLDTVLGIIAGGDNAAVTPLTVDMTRNVGNTADIYTDHAAGAILTAIEYLVEAARSRWMLGSTAAIEAFFPRWVRAAVRASIARKQGVNAYDVSDAQITSWFAGRGVRPQFIDYWQHVPGDFAGREFPNDFEAVLYPANSVVRVTQGELDLGSEIRDSTLNASNTYEMFREEFYATGFIAHEPVIATLPSAAYGVTYGTIDGVASDTVAPAHNARGNFDLA